MQSEEFKENRDLPKAFLKHLRRLEEAYLASDDPVRQSGFSGGPERWRREREPILEAVQNEAGSFLDACCANGYLLECLMCWGKERGLEITPFGNDQSARLVELARERLPEFASGLYVANAWHWIPPDRYQYVYALWDCVPEDYFEEFVRRLLIRFVRPGGRIILGAYGSYLVTDRRST